MNDTRACCWILTGVLKQGKVVALKKAGVRKTLSTPFGNRDYSHRDKDLDARPTNMVSRMRECGKRSTVKSPSHLVHTHKNKAGVPNPTIAGICDASSRHTTLEIVARFSMDNQSLLVIRHRWVILSIVALCFILQKRGGCRCPGEYCNLAHITTAVVSPSPPPACQSLPHETKVHFQTP